MADRVRQDWARLASLAEVEENKLAENAADRLWAEIERLRGALAEMEQSRDDWRTLAVALTSPHSGTCDELAPCQRCADRDELTELRAISSTARRMYASSDAGDHQDAAHASRTLRDLLGEA